jgi:PAS domain S-box-containing protein
MRETERDFERSPGEIFGEKLREFTYTPQEEIYLSGGSYADPILLVFIRVASIIFILSCVYDILFLPWNNLSIVLQHYLPGIALYIFFEITRLFGYDTNKERFHFILNLSLVIPLLHLTVAAPEVSQQVYLLIAVLLAGLYYIVPGRDFTITLAFSLIISLFFIASILYNEINFDNRWILYLLFFHLMILAGLMVTHLIQAMLRRLVRVSMELISQNKVFQHLKEEFCNTIDGLTLGVLLANEKGDILLHNERFLELSGNRDLDDIKSVRDIKIITAGKEQVISLDLLPGKSDIDEELRVQRTERNHWLRLKGFRIYPKLGEPQYLLLLEDITDQKQNELARDRLERHLEAVFSPDSSIILYERGEENIYFTDNVKYLTGYSAVELGQGEPGYESMVYSGDRPFIRKKYKNWCKAGKESILYLWYRLQRRDGYLIWIEERMSRIRSESGKEITTGILIDNTELKTTERMLRKSESSLKRAQEIAHIGSFRYAFAAREIEISDELCRIFEFEDADEIDWKSYKNYIKPEDIEEFNWKLERVLSGYEQIFSMEFRIRTVKNIEKVILLQMEFYWKGAAIISVEGSVMDITTRKELERQLFQNQKMEAIGTLAGGIAHDFNNILNIIMGYSSVISEQLPNEGDLWHKFDRINAASKRAKNLVGHILTISRQHESRRHAINLKELLTEHLELLRAAIPSVIDIRKELRSDSYIYGDPDQIEQVIMNLCTNASYAMKARGGRLIIRLADEDDFVRLEVEDTGGGIPSSVREKMFDPYYTTKPKGEGTGLGLAIVKGVIDGMDGRIKVESQKDEGTLFCIWFRRYEPGSRIDDEMKENIELDEPVSEKPRVMFIDDEEALLELFENYLENSGLEVKTFNEGISALAAMEENPSAWDILVSDVSLPEMDGLEIVRRMRIINPALPIILYSGFKHPAIIEQAKKSGVNKMLVKPVVPMEMLKEINKILNRDGV